MTGKTTNSFDQVNEVRDGFFRGAIVGAVDHATVIILELACKSIMQGHRVIENVAASFLPTQTLPDDVLVCLYPDNDEIAGNPACFRVKHLADFALVQGFVDDDVGMCFDQLFEIPEDTPEYFDAQFIAERDTFGYVFFEIGILVVDDLFYFINVLVGK